MTTDREPVTAAGLPDTLIAEAADRVRRRVGTREALTDVDTIALIDGFGGRHFVTDTPTRPLLVVHPEGPFTVTTPAGAPTRTARDEHATALGHWLLHHRWLTDTSKTAAHTVPRGLTGPAAAEAHTFAVCLLVPGADLAQMWTATPDPVTAAARRWHVSPAVVIARASLLDLPAPPPLPPLTVRDDVAALGVTLRSLWNASTSADADWSPTNPAAGQCCVTALIVQDRFGGDLVRATVHGVSHYWNNVDGHDIDLTRDQFPVFVPADEVIRTRTYALGSALTQARYQTLRSMVQAHADR